MEWTIILALVLAIPVILFPVAYVGYLTIGGALAAVRGEKKVTEKVKKGHVAAK
ncbi:MAG TPA: hypothetical protein VMW64_01155 [Dehalococcoidia bacterium]|nr:hypothetical protein [Dehalococcoidia bacterium]